MFRFREGPESGILYFISFCIRLSNVHSLFFKEAIDLFFPEKVLPLSLRALENHCQMARRAN